MMDQEPDASETESQDVQGGKDAPGMQGDQRDGRLDEFSEISERLDRIASQVKGKDVSLEQSLDLLEEAVALGTRAVDLVDVADPSDQELSDTAASEAEQEQQ